MPENVFLEVPGGPFLEGLGGLAAHFLLQKPSRGDFWPVEGALKKIIEKGHAARRGVP